MGSDVTRFMLMLLLVTRHEKMEVHERKGERTEEGAGSWVGGREGGEKEERRRRGGGGREEYQWSCQPWGSNAQERHVHEGGQQARG